MGESFIVERIEDWEDKLFKYIKLVYLLLMGRVCLRLFLKSNDEVKVKEDVDLLMEELVEKLKDIVIGFEEEIMVVDRIGFLLIK